MECLYNLEGALIRTMMVHGVFNLEGALIRTMMVHGSSVHHLENVMKLDKI